MAKFVFPIIEGTVIQTSSIVGPWNKTTVRVNRILGYDADTECEVITEQHFKNGTPIRFTFETVKGDPKDVVAITGKVCEVTKVIGEPAEFEHGTNLDDEASVIFQKATINIERIGDHTVNTRCCVITINTPQEGDNIVFRTMFPTGVTIRATVTDINPRDRKHVHLHTDVWAIDDMSCPVTMIPEDVGFSAQVMCSFTIPKDKHIKYETTCWFRFELCDHHLSETATHFGWIKKIEDVSEQPNLCALEINVTWMICKHEVEDTCWIILPKSKNFKEGKPISFTITPIHRIEGRVKKVSPCDEGSLITVDVNNINSNPVKKRLKFIVPQAYVPLGFDIKANVIFDKKGNVMQTQGVEFTYPTEEPGKHKLTICQKLGVLICWACGWLD